MRKFDLYKIFNNIIIVFLILIMFSGANLFSVLKYEYFIAILILLLLTMKKKKLIFHRQSLLLFVSILLLCSSCIYSIDINESSRYILIYFISFIFSIAYTDENNNEKLINTIEIAALVMASSIILTIFNHNFILNMDFLFPYKEAYYVTMSEVTGNIFSGLALERAYAAFGINLGLLVILSKILNSEKRGKWDIIKLIYLYIALFCCGKRMLLILPLLCLLFIIMLNVDRKKVGNLIKILAMLIIITTIAYKYIPGVEHLIGRLSRSFGDSSYNGRTDYWHYCFEMIKERPLFGHGINTYETYLRRNSNLPVYNAHNIYIQLYAELGIIGATFIILSILINIVYYIIIYMKVKKKIDNHKKIYINTAFAYILLFFVYGLTGNTLYYYDQLIVLFISFAILNSYLIHNKKRLEKTTLQIKEIIKWKK